MSVKLRQTKDNISERKGNYREHGTPIRQLIGPAGMRVIGRAFDLGVIKK